MHSHSGQFCLHAKPGSLEDVVQRAIAMRFVTYGLSEHMPRTRMQDLYPEESHLQPEDTQATFRAYYVEARRLQAKYADQIALLVGMETELIHDKTLDEINEIQRELPLDYLVGSVHHVLGHPIDFDEVMYKAAEDAAFAKWSTPCPGICKTEAVFREYFDAQYELLARIKPVVVGHLDLIRVFRQDHALSLVVWEKIRRNIQLIKDYGGIVEVNSRAWKKNILDAHPQSDIMKVLIEEGVRLTLSDDSHGPNDVGLNFGKLKEYMADANVEEIYYPRRTGSGVIEVFKMNQLSSHPAWSQICAGA
ncbi:histidinolphosphatase [Irineochytrium annulatum]|nr:histidinolphosphatase [Irineochytrium annulatum]